VTPPAGFASRPVDPESLPWIPLGPGESFKPLLIFRNGKGRVLLLRLDPGRRVARHRHQGEVHATNLSGRRKLLESGEVVGPGGYVYEPPGNVDSWMAVGDEPAVVHIVAHGAMEYLDDAGGVTRRDTAASLLERYHGYCAENGLTPIDLSAAHCSDSRTMVVASAASAAVRGARASSSFQRRALRS
jgi:2,4'-dihydroxyacetophenone dioxygenase